LREAPLFIDIADAVEGCLQDAVVVAHNAQFDLQFLDSEFRRLGREVQIPNLIDTLHLARGRFEFPSYTLSTIAEAFMVDKAESHRAIADALTCKAIFFNMMELLGSEGRPLDDYIGIYNSPVWPEDGVQLPTALEEAVYSGKRLRITYQDGDGRRTERWVTPIQVLGLSDYIYLKAYCHLRKAERNFRLDRMLDFSLEEQDSKPKE
jgi:DNA polymerase III epsilon subunit-like protein